MKHPQLSLDNEIKPTEEQVVSGGSIDARMKRVIGAGKRGKGKLTITHGGESHGGGPISSLGIPIVSGIAGLFGRGKGEMDGASNGVMKGGAYGEGAKLAKHLETLHGAGWLSDFWEGFKSVVKPVANIASFIPGPIGTIGKVASGVMGLGKGGQAILPGMTRKGRGRPRKMTGGAGGGTTSAPPAGFEVEHAVADSQVAPNTRPAVAYGNPPQPSAGFMKNTVGMGRGGNVFNDVECMAGGKKKRAPSKRNVLISQLMKGKGMSLGQASKYLKEHPEG